MTTTLIKMAICYFLGITALIFISMGIVNRILKTYNKEVKTNG